MTLSNFMLEMCQPYLGRYRQNKKASRVRLAFLLPIQSKVITPNPLVISFYVG